MENKILSKNRVETFVRSKAPRYRPILPRIPEDKLLIDPAVTDKDLDIALHKQLAEIESKLLEEGHELMTYAADEDLEEYKKRLSSYQDVAKDIKKSDLANYVFHRKTILDILEKAIQRDENGNYAREEIIHNLIMPMKKDSTELMLDHCNLWIVDEKLAFHDYLASAKPLANMPITRSVEMKTPDICSLNIFDNPLLVAEGTKVPLASIVIIEIKRPMRNDAAEGEEKDPIEQALGYLDRIRKGGVQTANGRQILGDHQIPGFCYVLCDITSSIKRRCELIYSATLSSDKLGYFYYNSNLQAFVEIISFDGLINRAKERNRAFFDKLGLPAT